MATVKKANVPPTHPTVWVGLALAVVGLLVATYAYTGVRVYEVAFAFVALGGAVLALAGIMLAAWGRSIMAARASRSRRAAFKDDALALAKPVPVTETMSASAPSSEDAPTIAAPREKKRFSFPMPKRAAKPKEETTSAAGVFAFRRRGSEPERAAPAPQPSPEAARETAPEAAPSSAAPPVSDDPRDPAVSARLSAELEAIGDLQEPKTVRVTLKCPSCATTFSAEGVRPFQAVCSSCGFSAMV